MNQEPESTGKELSSSEIRSFHLFKRFLRLLRKLLLTLNLSYGVFLLILPLLWLWIGERNLSLAFSLYFPRAGYLLPAIGLLVPALFFTRKSAAFLLITCLTFIGRTVHA